MFRWSSFGSDILLISIWIYIHVYNMLPWVHSDWWRSWVLIIPDGVAHSCLIFSFVFLLPSMRGCQKLVYRLIVMFLSTEIFSKRRKIYAWNWRETRVNLNELFKIDPYLQIIVSKRCGIELEPVTNIYFLHHNWHFKYFSIWNL